MLAYVNEPETEERDGRGTPAEFIAAYRHVQSIFDQQGATNVLWTLTMTPFAFSADAPGDRQVGTWYPGDEWVDIIGVDAYNWISCGWGHGRYLELADLADPALAFARAHGKKVSFPEFASDATDQRAQWLSNAHTYMAQNRDVIAAAFYLNRPPLYSGNEECGWPLTSPAEYGALRAMALDTATFTH
jgi:beta-mannanase